MNSKIGMKVLGALRANGIDRIGRTDIFISDDTKAAGIIEDVTNVRELHAALQACRMALQKYEYDMDIECTPTSEHTTLCSKVDEVLKKYDILEE